MAHTTSWAQRRTLSTAYDKQHRFEHDRFINPGEDFTPEPEAVVAQPTRAREQRVADHAAAPAGLRRAHARSRFPDWRAGNAPWLDPYREPAARLIGEAMKDTLPGGVSRSSRTPLVIVSPVR